MIPEGTHPRLRSALEAMERGDDGWAAEVVSIGLGARFAREDGKRCECAEPIVSGSDLMCSRCLLENRGQELRKLDEMFGPHDFKPRDGKGVIAAMCDVCSYWQDDPVHHGQAKPCKTSWGESYLPGDEATEEG